MSSRQKVFSFGLLKIYAGKYNLLLSDQSVMGILFEERSDLNEFFVFKPFGKKSLHIQGSAGWIRRDYPHIGRDFLSWELKNTRLDLCKPIQ